MESASVAVDHAEHHHGPPEAHQSSRIDRQTLGILLFIVSEVMLFGAFFASYFFLRVVANEGAVAARTASSSRSPSLASTRRSWSRSSFTVHWALESVRRQPAPRPDLGLATTWLLGFTFLFIQINEYVHIGFSARDEAFGTIFYGLTGLHGAHVSVGLMLLAFANIRAWRGHFGPEAEGPPRRRGARASTGTSWTGCGSSSSRPSTSSSAGPREARQAACFSPPRRRNFCLCTTR